MYGLQRLSPALSSGLSDPGPSAQANLTRAEGLTTRATLRRKALFSFHCACILSPFSPSSSAKILLTSSSTHSLHNTGLLGAGGKNVVRGTSHSALYTIESFPTPAL